MTWIDLLLAVLFAVFIALGAERRLGGLVLGLGGVLLLRPLLLLGRVNPLLAVVAALVAGLIFALITRRLGRPRRVSPLVLALLGGLGGGLLGAALVLSASVSLPLERNSANQLVYPPQSMPALVAPAVRGSRVFREGRDILLYPLLDAQGDISASRRPVLEALHSYLVVGEPWEGR
jgi:xanthosine utilization system XapX-like protein